MTLPTPDQFEEFYKTVYEKADDPTFGAFPWQRRLAKLVHAGDWPRAIALPTAAGKTACIDIAVFALACRAKDAPRRIFFVVDRRIVVDQAWLHSKHLARVLREARTGILKTVADSLRDLARDEDERPLDVYALRGGMYRESAWARSPLQPTIIASTVDQVGSRLLFRGYGVSDSMKPIHAGLVGNDSLILLDEAHCAKPFDQTVQSVEKYRTWSEGSSQPFKFVSITATPTGGVPTLRDDDEDRNHPVLGRRINASKPASLVVAKNAKGAKGRVELVKELEKQARELAKEFVCVGIIVNRVATARELHDKLGDDAVLLTGRMRPLDRDRLFEEKLKPLLSNSDGSPPKFVIGTQCLECGADFDFHALVTECASLDALRQRFGRLNRVAKRQVAKAVVVIRSDEIDETTEDPVYGESLANTWKWLKSKAANDVFDFGVAAVRAAIADEDISNLNAPAADAPVLFPAHLDCWVQTHPIPEPDPDPALFLHGPNKPGQPDVQVVFRSDLGDGQENWVNIVALCPPSSSEAVAVPINVFRRWLAAETIDDQSGDVEGEASEPDEDKSITRFALRWRGPEKSGIVKPGEVTPNDVYVVPSTASDVCMLGDFYPPFETPADYAEQAFQRSRDKALLRLPGLELDEDSFEFEEELSAAVRSKIAQEHPDWSDTVIDNLTNEKRRTWERYPEPVKGFVVTGKFRLCQFDPTYLDDSEPESSFRGRRSNEKPITLEAHCWGVAKYAETFAKACGLPSDTYQIAGLYHDLGKMDPRFQAMLRQSSPRTAVGELLAKSARVPRTKQERDQAREVHRYPSGARHELLSAALVASKSNDDLLLHLIATHHGSGRPFAYPVIENNDANTPCRKEFFGFKPDSCIQDVLLWNAELPERFWRVVRKYGWWGTAFREAIFRLADHTQSRVEQESDWKPKTANLSPAIPSGKVAAPPRHLLPLVGLDGANPLAFLAAVGTLRLADEFFPGTQLRWELAGRWQPILELPTKISDKELLTRLFDRLHRVVDANAGSVADEGHKKYRAKKKETEKAMKSVKDRKLRGNERDRAIVSDVAPLLSLELSARREWLEALESAVPAPFLSLGKSIAVSGTEFAAFASRIAERLQREGPPGRSDADFASSFGCEACVDRNGRVIPTEFQLITGSGHQFFLETFANLMESVTVEQLGRALFGPWEYADPRLSFRWDPIDDRRYAMNWDDPSSMEVRTEHGANLLAAFALPLFPVAPQKRGARTTGFELQLEEPCFTWPIWTVAHGPDAVRSLFQLECLHDVNARSLWDQFGVRFAFQVRKVEVGKPPLSKLNLCPAVTV